MKTASRIRSLRGWVNIQVSMNKCVALEDFGDHSRLESGFMRSTRLFRALRTLQSHTLPCSGACSVLEVLSTSYCGLFVFRWYTSVTVAIPRNRSVICGTSVNSGITHMFDSVSPAANAYFVV